MLIQIGTELKKFELAKRQNIDSFMVSPEDKKRLEHFLNVPLKDAMVDVIGECLLIIPKRGKDCHLIHVVIEDSDFPEETELYDPCLVSSPC